MLTVADECGLVLYKRDVHAFVKQTPKSFSDSEGIFYHQVTQIMRQVVPIARKFPIGRTSLSSHDVDVITATSVAHKRHLHAHAQVSRMTSQAVCWSSTSVQTHPGATTHECSAVGGDPLKS